MTTLEDFARLVRSMRTAQRVYFRDRGAQSLEESKRRERDVDDAVKAILDQPQLPIMCQHEYESTEGGHQTCKLCGHDIPPPEKVAGYKSGPERSGA